MTKQDYKNLMTALVTMYRETERLHNDLQAELHRVFLELKKMNQDEKSQSIKEIGEQYERLKRRRDNQS
jgi:hypothetical protein